MPRPSATGQALGRSPLMQASWADASRIERVPLIAAGAEPFVFFAGRPAAEWAANARGAGALFLRKVAIQNSGFASVIHDTWSFS